MNRVSALSLVLILGSMNSTAQSFGHYQTQPAILESIPLSTDCPIDMRAQQRIGGETLALNGGRVQGAAQPLHLTMSNLRSLDIVGAQITVHGFAAKTRLLPAKTAGNDSFEVTKTFDLDLTVKVKGDASTDLRLQNFTAISLIDLDAVTYADGSTWRSSASKKCHVAPDGLMLISSR